MSGDFSGKIALITGAGSGIGRETAFSFADAGATLVLVDIDASGLDRTALLCRKLGATVHTRITDVASAEAMESLSVFVHESVGVVDVLVNNAGIGVAGSFVGTELRLWDLAISVNLKGVVHGCHFFLPKMIDRGRGGHIVNVASAAGLAAPKNMPIYAATKFAVVGFSESLRAELSSHRISVTTICPGIIDTPITRSTQFSGDLAGKVEFREKVAAFYHRRNYAPGRVASVILDAVRHRRGLVPVTPEAWALYYAKRLAPRLLGALMARELPF